MKKRVIATFAASDGRSAKSIRQYEKIFDSYEQMKEYQNSEKYTCILFWWYLPDWR